MKKTGMYCLLSVGILGFALQANAAPSEGVTADDVTKQVTSDATVTVKPGDETPTEPVDPNEPGGETGQKGPLSIDNVIVFAFNEMKLSSKTQDVSLISKKSQNVQVTDTRGTGEGWNLQIKQTPLVNVDDASKVLNGAYIKFNDKTASIIAGSEETVSASPKSNHYGQTFRNKEEFAPLMTADKDQGMGTWLLKYAGEDASTKETGIQLEVPSGNYVGAYKGSVVWSLQNSPTAEPAK